MSRFLLWFRQATRSLRRAPAFTALAVTVLATGIGAATVMYTLVHAVLLRELPVDEPDRLVWMYNTRTERDRAPLSLPDFEDYRREASTLAGLAVFTNWTTNRAALGARQRELTSSMLRRELWPPLVGLASGLVITLSLASILFGTAFAISPRDVATYVEAGFVLLAVATVATYIPVRRAAAADPSEVLSTE